MRLSQWVIASMSAGIGGVFVFLTYVHATFITYDEMITHVSQPHAEAVQESRYNEDIRYLREQITEINRKIDRALQK